MNGFFTLGLNTILCASFMMVASLWFSLSCYRIMRHSSREVVSRRSSMDVLREGIFHSTERISSTPWMSWKEVKLVVIFTKVLYSHRNEKRIKCQFNLLAFTICCKMIFNDLLNTSSCPLTCRYYFGECFEKNPDLTTNFKSNYHSPW
jgi:hypothetical protein